MYIIGGEDEDHTKLNDFWSFDLNSRSWEKIEAANSEEFCRSGASASTKDGKIYIFGGILEITKELNDMYVFDSAANSISKHDDGQLKPDQGVSLAVKAAALDPGNKNSLNAPSPARKGTQVGGASPNRQRTNAGQSPGRHGASPSRKQALAS